MAGSIPSIGMISSLPARQFVNQLLLSVPWRGMRGRRAAHPESEGLANGGDHVLQDRVAQAEFVVMQRKIDGFFANIREVDNL